MRESIGQDVVIVGQVQDDVDHFLRRRVEGFDAFFASFYKERLLTTVALVDAIDAAATGPAAPLPEVSSSEPPVADEGVRRRFRDKWKRGSDEGKVSIEGGTVPGETTLVAAVRPSVATPVPTWDVSEGSRTPTSRTARTSFAFSQVTWGDRFRSMTPVDSPLFRPMEIPHQLPPQQTLLDNPIAAVSQMDVDQSEDPEGQEGQIEAEAVTAEAPVATDAVTKEDEKDGAAVSNDLCILQQDDGTGEVGEVQNGAVVDDPEVKNKETCNEDAQSVEADVTSKTVVEAIVSPVPEKPSDAKPVDAMTEVKEVQKEAPQQTAAKMEGVEHGKIGEREAGLQGRKESLIPKPPGGPPVSTVQKMKNLVTLVDQVPVHLMDLTTTTAANQMAHETAPPPTALANDKTQDAHSAKEADGAQQVRSFIDAVKRAEEHKIAAGTHKAEIPALKKAAAAREQEQKREAERKKRKEQMTQWKQQQHQKKQTVPTKLASKPEAPSGAKRPTEIEPSPNKKQRTEQTRRHKKNLQQAASRLITPSGTPIPMVV